MPRLTTRHRSGVREPEHCPGRPADRLDDDSRRRMLRTRDALHRPRPVYIDDTPGLSVLNLRTAGPAHGRPARRAGAS
ncbi:MAG: hypothetical protein V9G24_16485 [Rhodoblastus sp.]